jgi:7tm Odorant receptor
MVVLTIILVIVQLWTLCYFGERLPSASEEIMNASFENNWMDQPPSFKRSLLIIRQMAQKELKITAGEITLNRENFYKVRTLILVFNFD